MNPENEAYTGSYVLFYSSLDIYSIIIYSDLFTGYLALDCKADRNNGGLTTFEVYG